MRTLVAEFEARLDAGVEEKYIGSDRVEATATLRELGLTQDDVEVKKAIERIVFANSKIDSGW